MSRADGPTCKITNVITNNSLSRAQGEPVRDGTLPRSSAARRRSHTGPWSNRRTVSCSNVLKAAPERVATRFDSPDATVSGPAPAARALRASPHRRR